MTTKLLALATALALLTSCSNSTKTDDQKVSLSGCYTSQVGPDRAYLDIKETGTSVRGILEYAFSQKDSSWGLVTGEVTDTTLELNYEYLSEGVLSTRTLSLKRDGEKLSGEGWTYQPTQECGIGDGWQASLTSDVRVDTFHDPETGYYARSFFKIAGPLNGYSYRCISTVSNDAGKVVAQWVGSGITDTTNATRTQNMQTNIRPDQVSEISVGSVICQTRAS